MSARRRSLFPWIASIGLVLTGLFAAGCGEDREAGPSDPDPAPTTAEGQRQHDQSLEQGQRKPGPERDGPRATKKARDDAGEGPAERQPPGSKEPRKGFDAVVDQLPIRTGPLPIAQYITSEASDNVVARVKPQDFFCGRSAEERIAVVESLYEQAARRFRAAGADFRLTVAELTDRIVGYSIYARSTQGSISLTAAGGGAGPC